MKVSIRINDEDRNLDVEPRRTLLDALRHDLELTGTKKACDRGNCGACTVLLNDQAVYACLVLAVECADERIVTIEGLGSDGELDAVQQAFLERDALQCGYCTPGQIMSIKALEPFAAELDAPRLRRELSGNLCRCGAYRHIEDAAREVLGVSGSTEHSGDG